LADPPKRVYWDSCAWIGLINNEPQKMTPLRAIWDGAERGQYRIYTSTFSYLEVIDGHTPMGQAYPPQESDLKIFEMFEQPYVMRIQVDTEVAKSARQLKRQHHPTLASRADAIHLASALHCNAEELHTWDHSHLLPFNEKCHRIDGKPLVICKPGFVEPGPLFAKPGAPNDK
jgi:predicted nucleic acid-binding protein